MNFDVFLAYAWNSGLSLYFFSSIGTPDTLSSRKEMNNGPTKPNNINGLSVESVTKNTPPHQCFTEIVRVSCILP